MSRRRKFQSLDWVMGALRNIATNEKYSARDRQAAIDRAAVVDGIYDVALKSLREVNNNSVAESAFPSPEPDVDVDSILERIGGTNGNA